MTVRALLLLGTLIGAVHAFSSPPKGFKFAGRGTVDAVMATLARTIGPSAAAMFDLQMVSNCSQPAPSTSRSSLCFDLLDAPASSGKTVTVRGTSAPEIAFGAAHYLRTYANMSFAWPRTGGNRVAIPTAWPRIGHTITKYRAVDWSYFQNVVTYSYTFPWYQESDWQRLYDWAVLNGINLALAYTGQEEVYRKVFKGFGVNDTDFAAWCNGPAFLAWARGQGTHGQAAPLPMDWMSSQWKLQRSILSMMRGLGIVPILPAFQGNVPPQFRTLFPHANITKKNTPWIDSLDPLFGRVGDAFVKQIIADFGTDHWYEADGYFDQHRGPWVDVVMDRIHPRLRALVRSLQRAEARGAQRKGVFSKYKSAEDVPADPGALAHAVAAYTAMNRTDPDAVWFYQGWIWRGFTEDQLPFMKGFISAPPKDHFVILDMWDEVIPMWSEFNNFSFFGTPFVWATLHNFGGNTGLWGSLQTLNSNPQAAFAVAKSVHGTGFCPEGFDQNPMYYQFVTDMNWMAVPVSLEDWMNAYALQRYGVASPEAAQAWQLLLQSVYGPNQPIKAEGGFYAEKAHDALTAMPLVGGSSLVQPLWYNLSDVQQAWSLLVSFAQSKFTASTLPSTLRYDLVNTGREYLAKQANVRYHALVNASTVSAVTAAGDDLLEIMGDADALLCSSDGMRLAGWLQQARAWGTNASGGFSGSADYYEWNARSQPTVWVPQLKGVNTFTGLLDYANKQWGGLVGTYYRGRDHCYIKQAVSDFGAHRKLNETAYVACAAQWSYQWTNDFQGKSFPICWTRTGDAIAISAQLLKKYPLH